jgi:branched-chain amino acid transport system permease protein
MKPKLVFALLGLGLLAAILIPLPLSRYGIYLAALTLIYAIAAHGLNLTMGYAGQISIGHAAFFGIGAYSAGLLMVKLGFAFWLTLPVAALLCFALGLLLGFPALRVQHHYLAFATLGFNTLIFLVIRNEEWLTGGTFGLNGIPRPSIAGFAFTKDLSYYYLVLAFFVAASFILWWIVRSPWGRAFNALRDNAIRAESVRIDIRAYTLLAFAIGAAYAGVAGVLFASLVNFIEPAPFGIPASISMLLMVVVGGIGRFWGPLLGAVLVTLLPEWLRGLQDWYLVAFGLFVMVLMVYDPGGLLGLPDRIREWRRKRDERRNHAAA